MEVEAPTWVTTDRCRVPSVTARQVPVAWERSW